MSRWSYLLAVLAQAKGGPYFRIAASLYAILGAISLLKSEFTKSTSVWANSRTIDWIPAMSLEGWTILGLALAFGVGFEAAYRIYRRQSEQLTAFQSAAAEAPPPEEPALDEALDDLADELLRFLDDSPNAYQSDSIDRDLLLMGYKYDFGPSVRKMKKAVSASVDSETTLAMFDLEIANEADIAALAEFLRNLAAKLRPLRPVEPPS